MEAKSLILLALVGVALVGGHVAPVGGHVALPSEEFKKGKVVGQLNL